MATTNNLGITLVEQSQAQKEVTINQAFALLDAFVGKSVLDKDLATPPGSPAASALYIVAASPTGSWSGKATYLAYFDQVWKFITPQNGMRVYVQDESIEYKFNGTSWSAAGGGSASWGGITGTLSSQTDLQTALNAKAPLASPTFTGTVTLPAGQVVNGVTLTTGGGTTNFLRADGTYAAPSGGGGGSWGSITGTLSSQTDLQTALNAKADLTGAAFTGASSITSSSATAFAVGASGATNSALLVDASTASSATGWAIKSAAATGGVTLTVASSGSNESGTIAAKGTGDLFVNGGTAVRLQTGSTNRVIINSTSAQTSNTISAVWSSMSASNTAATVRFSVLNATDATLTASTEAPHTYWNLANTVRTHAAGALTLQRDFRITGSDHAFASSSTLTDHAILALDWSTGASTNATITNTSALYVPSVTLTGTKTNAYGLNISAPAGATNNYAARLAGTAGEIFRVRTDGQMALLATNTATGTTGAQTINKPSGTVNFAAAATSLVVTNALCTTSSIIIATVRTNDSTMKSVQAVPGSGSFTLYANAAATAETSVGFLIIN